MWDTIQFQAIIDIDTGKFVLLEIVGGRFGSLQSVVSFPQSVAVLFLRRVGLACEGPGLPPLTGLTLTVAVVVPEEILSVHAGDLLPRHDVPQDLDAGPVPAGGHELAVWSAVVVDVGGGAKPQLGAVFPGTEINVATKLL